MTLQPPKQQIMIENLFEDFNIEKNLLHSTSYELVIIDSSGSDLLARLSPTTVAIIGVNIPNTAKLLSQLPGSIKVIVKYGVGYEKVDVDVCRRRGIEVCYTPDYGTNTVADHTVALLFAAHRHLLTFHLAILVEPLPEPLFANLVLILRYTKLHEA
ncbi:unnamed protein product [Adineta steineri]|uniref:D-isomer specific 2-hydroxyacid dehydrogenase catalytic domain-containing protein n=1 Tax=Adineta steineri TaxID=433720 RepID=A0A819TRU3_9BILA|nr:unnamed protein product [Adineta steineri]